MGTFIQRLKHLITALVIIAFNFNNVYAQCPPEVSGIVDVDVLADLNCMGVADWTEPTYSLVCEDFDDGFDHASWTPSGVGTVLTTTVTTLELQGALATAGTLNYCIDIPCNGTIAFTWSARMWDGTMTGGSFNNDEVGYSIAGGTQVELANSGSTANGMESGLIIPDGGGEFCFFVNSGGSGFWSELTITDFVFTPGIERTDGGIVKGSTQATGCYTIEYTVCDCNFIPSTCSFDVCINDETGPTVACPMDITVDCLDLIPAPATTVTEFNAIDIQSSATDCSGLVEAITSSDAPMVDRCVGGNILRTYFFEDLEGNPRQCGQWINVEPDDENPVINNPGNIGWGQNLPCGQSDPHSLETMFNEGFPLVNDNCFAMDILPADFEADINIPNPWDGTAVLTNNVTLSYVDVVNAAGTICANPTTQQRKYSITRTWTVLDQCDNVATVDQNINVGDNLVLPTAVPVAGDVVLNLDAACSAVLDVSMIEGGSFDNCGSTDPLDPTPFDVPGSAMIRIEGSGDPFATSLTIDPSDFDFLTVCPAIVSIELMVTDRCDNTGVALKDVMVTDVIAPVINTCPPNETFEGCSEADIMGLHLPYSPTTAPASFTNFTDVGGVYTDACGLLSITYIDVLTMAGCPTTPHTTITRTWTLTDGCNGTATCDQILDFEDTMSPSFVGTPENIMLDQGLQCGEDYHPHELESRFGEGFPSVSDVCGIGTITPDMFANYTIVPWDGSPTTIAQLAGITIAYSDDVIPHPNITLADPCPGPDNGKFRVHRTWTITDACGNVLTSDPVPTGGGFVFQRINIGDVTDPVITTCPTAYAAQVCSLNDVATAGQPAYSSTQVTSDIVTFNGIGGVASDNCGITAVSYQDINLVSAPMLITFDREWTISDGCNVDATCVQTFSLTVNDPPVILDCPVSLTIDLSSTSEYIADPNACSAEITFVAPTFTDDCDGVAVTDFSGDFAVANWTESGDIPVDVSGAPTSIELTGSNSSTTNTDFCINVPAHGFVNFDWSASMDLPGGQLMFDEPQFVINGVAQTLPDMTAGVNSDMGTEMIAVLAGDQICFRVVSNNAGAYTILNISSFSISSTMIEQTGGPTSPYMESVGGTCTATETIEWTVTDGAGKQTVCTYDITLRDDVAPVLTSVGIDCSTLDMLNQNACFGSIPAPTEAQVAALYSDACNTPVTATAGTPIVAGDNCGWIIHYPFEISDNCGNTTTCEVTHSGADATAPAFIDPPNNIDRTQGLTCQMAVDPHALEDAFSEGFPDVSDNCLTANVTAADFYAGITAPWDGTATNVNGITISYTDNVIVHPDGACTETEQRKYRIERTWTIEDDCGNSMSSDPAPGGGGFDYQRINVVDGPTDPTAVPTNLNIVLEVDTNCEATLNAGQIEGGSFDNCGIYDPLDPSVFSVPTTAMIRRAGTADPFATSLSFDDNDFDFSVNCPFTISIELMVTDECGNIGTALKDITIADTTNPVIGTCPPSATFEGCDESAIAAPHLPYSATEMPATLAQFQAVGGDASDNCEFSITYVDSFMDTGCPNPNGNVMRTWTLIDDCGNVAACNQLLDIQDTTEPDFELAPGDILPENIPFTFGVACDDPKDPHSLEDAYERGFPIVSDNCLANDVTALDFYNNIPSPWDGSDVIVNGIMISYSDVISPVFVFNCADPYQLKYRIHRTWVITDACGNSMSSNPFLFGGGFPYQVIAVGDQQTDPTAVPVVADVELLLDANCQTSLTADMINGRSFDNCGVNDPNDPSTFDVNDNPLIRVFGSGDAFSSSIDFDDTDFDLAAMCPFEITIELQVTDQCGNTGTATKDITITDEINPTITCPPNMSFDLGPITCDTIITYSAPVANDNCSTPSVALISGLASGEVFPIGTTTQVYEATDDCGNTMRCEFDITINEYVPDGLTCKNINVSLNDDCVADIKPDMVADLIGCVDNYEITLTDAHGNEVSNPVDDRFLGEKLWYTLTRINTGPNLGIECWGEVLIELKQKPEITCRPQIISACSSLDLVPLPTASGKCSTYEIRLIDQIEKDMECDDTYVAEIIRTYVAIDAVGNVSDPCEQSILLLRISRQDFDCPADTTLECSSNYLKTDQGYPDPSVTGYPTESGTIILPGVTNPYCNSFVDFEDQLVFDSGCKVRIMRFWTINEWWCDKEETYRCPQVIDIIDTLGPVLTPIRDMTVSTNEDFICGANVTLPSITAVDQCDNGPLKYEINYPTGFNIGENGGTEYFDTGDHLIEYIVTDHCGNSSTSTLTITVEDIRQPVAICDFNSVVSLSGSGMAVLNAEVFDDGSWDDCGILKFEVARMETVCDSMDLQFGPSVRFCCADVNMSPMVAFRVTDYSGNSNTCMVAVNVQDKIKPELTCLDNVTVDCTENLDINNLRLRFGMPSVSDSCVVSAVVETPTADIDQCGKGTIERLFTLTDQNGEVQTCTQIITIIDNTPFTEFDIDWPDDLATDMICDEGDLDPDDLLVTFPSSAYPDYTDDECSLIGENYTDELFDFSSGSTACFKLLRTWKVINWCDTLPNGRFTTFERVQEIKISNTDLPVITGSTDTLIQCSFNLDCSPDEIELRNTAEDQCTDSIDLVWSYVIDGTITGVGNDASGTYDLGEHTIVWTVRDRCGNSATSERVFEIRNCKAPIPVCRRGLSAGLEGMDLNGDGIVEDEMTFLNARFFDGGSYHNCNNPIAISFSQNPMDTMRTFDCEDLKVDSTRVNMWVTDLLTGAQDFCETYVKIQDNNTDTICKPESGGNFARIAGQIYTEERENVEDVSVELKGSEMNPEMTDFEGRYTFPNMPFGGDYTIDPAKNLDFLNGVSTLDLVLIQRHILGLSKLDSPYKLIAADVNADNTVSALDLIDIRKMILGIYDEFPSNDSWRFVDEGFTFADPEQPWLSAFAEDYNIQSLSNNMSVDFIGMKIGDVNATAKANFDQENVDNRNSALLDLNVESQDLKAGEKSLIKIFAPEFNGTSGFQFAIDYDMDRVEVLALASTEILMNESNYSIDILRDGVFGISWHKTSGSSIKMDPSEALIEVYVQAKEDVNTSELFRMSNMDILAEAYKDGDIYGLGLKTLEGTDLSSTEAILYQNSPNPWVDHTEIRFFLPISGEASLRVFSSTGELVRKLDRYFDNGLNTISLNKADFPQGGLYTYELIYKDQMITKRMIILN